MKTAYMCRGGAAPFAALRLPSFRYFWSSTLFFEIAQWAQLGIQAWLVLTLTSTPVSLAPYTASRFLPKLVLSPLAGFVADRVDRMKMLLCSQLLLALVSLAMAAHFTAGGSLWGLIVLNGLLSAIFAFDQPARRAVLPRLVGWEHLLCAVSLGNSAFSMAVVMGPVLSAVLLSGLGTLATLYINFALYVVALLLLLPLWRLQAPPAREEADAQVGHRFLDGIRYLQATPIVAGLLLVSMFPGFLDRLFVLFLPVAASEAAVKAAHLGDLMAIARGAGAVVGALLLAAWGQVRLPHGMVLPVALACAAASALFLFVPGVHSSLAVLGIAGLLRSVLSSLTTTLLHIRIPDSVRGRIMAI